MAKHTKREEREILPPGTARSMLERGFAIFALRALRQLRGFVVQTS
jgi:hypothetical protein